ncbi:hypothetical protein [Pseudomonas putida]|nr:hypothetical protein [Pseudomonas putida]
MSVLITLPVADDGAAFLVHGAARYVFDPAQARRISAITADDYV